MRFHHLPEASGLSELAGVLFELDHDGGAALLFFCWSYFETPMSARAPEGGLGVRSVGLGGDRHLVGHHKDRVEPHPELTDQLPGGTGVPPVELFHGLDKTFGARVGDGAEVGHELLLGHAETGVAHGEAPGIRIRFQPDAELELGREHLLALQ